MIFKTVVLITTLVLLYQNVSTEELNDNDKSDNKTKITDRSSHVHEDPTYKGFWKKKFIWRPRWVKTWKAKKVYVAVWKRMWGPVQLKEWVPIPKPPPGWIKHGHTSNAVVIKKLAV